MRFIFFTLSLFSSLTLLAQDGKRLTDSEQLIRLEVLITERFNAIDQRFDAMDKRIDGLEKKIDDNKADLQRQINGLEKKIDDVKTDSDKKLDRVWMVVLWGAGLLLTGMFTLIGFILWDRRSYLSAIKEQLALISEHQRLLDRRQRRNSAVIDKLVEDDPRLKEVLEEVAEDLDPPRQA